MGHKERVSSGDLSLLRNNSRHLVNTCCRLGEVGCDISDLTQRVAWGALPCLLYFIHEMEGRYSDCPVQDI